jgi:hypothetical protein
MMVAYFAWSLCQVAPRALFMAVARALGGSALMYLLVTTALQSLPGGDVLRLLLAVALGAAFFTAWSLVSWWLAGRPEGLESTALDFLRAQQQKRARAGQP